MSSGDSLKHLASVRSLLWKEPRKSMGMPLKEKVSKSVEKERFVEKSRLEVMWQVAAAWYKYYI